MAVVALAVIVVAMTTGCVSSAQYENMRERAQRAEQQRDELAFHAAKQAHYIRQLEGGMMIQAAHVADLRSQCEL